jgi:5-methyltetrahydrofolate--homocysteine methyltransferase
MSQSLIEGLKSGPVLVADGATGTMLQAAGLPGGVIPEQWNVDQPAKIAALHQAYLEAGSRIIVSNTFGGNRIKLGRAKKADLAAATNHRAVEIARAAAEPFGAFVAADMGPTGELLEPYGDMTFEAAVATYAEQARFLAEAGADALWLETLSDVNEARAAIEGIRQVTTLPILCSFSFDSHGRTMMGLTPKKAAETLGPFSLAALGANCGASLDDTMAAVTAMAAVLPDLPLVAKPNAGLPRVVDGQSVYETTPEEMAGYAVRFVSGGARVVGGCCGSTPAHIAMIARAVNTA